VARRVGGPAGPLGDRGPDLNRLLLDTTFLVDAERTDATLDEVIGDDDDVAVAAVTVAELRSGVLLATGRRRRSREAFVAELLDTVAVVPYDLGVAEAHAALLVAVRRQGRPRGAHDLVIAATARATGRSVVTADEAAFVLLPGVEVHRFR
jgi:tRNA(fMet)-specific endonuclease VapC